MDGALGVRRLRQKQGWEGKVLEHRSARLRLLPGVCDEFKVRGCGGTLTPGGPEVRSPEDRSPEDGSPEDRSPTGEKEGAQKEGAQKEGAQKEGAQKESGPHRRGVTSGPQARVPGTAGPGRDEPRDHEAEGRVSVLRSRHLARADRERDPAQVDPESPRKEVGGH